MQPLSTGEPDWSRTSDPQIKSLLLYQLSYRPNRHRQPGKWYSQGESNPCFRRERAASWTTRRWERLGRPHCPDSSTGVNDKVLSVKCLRDVKHFTLNSISLSCGHGNISLHS